MGKLTEEQVRGFEREGYLVIERLFDAAELAEALEFESEKLRAMSRDKLLASRVEIDEDLSHEPYFIKIDGAQDLHPPMAVLCHDPRLTGAAARLFGEPAVLFKDKLVFKPPRAQGFVPHQDMVYGYHRMVTRAISCMIAMDAADVDNGCLEVVPGRHRDGFFSGAEEDLDEGRFRENAWLPVALETGDVLLFDGLLPHRSGSNRSPRPRKTYIVTYNPASDGDWYATYYAWRHEWVAEDYPVRFAGSSKLPSKMRLA